MQVNLLSLHDAALLNGRMGGVLLSMQGGSFEPLLRSETRGVQEGTPPADERDAEALAAQVPTGSAEVINEAERNMEGTSRAFHRQVAREGATSEFREARQAHRQALQKEGADPVCRGSRGAGARSELQSEPKSNDKSDAASVTKPRPAEGGSVKASAAKAASGSWDPRGATAATSARVATPPGHAVTSSAGSPTVSTAKLTNTVAARGLPNAVGATRTAVLQQGQAGVKPGAAGGAKGVAQGPTASLAARGSARGGTFSAVRADGSRAAENADRTANIARIVRMIAQRIRGERSHTVMRLEPPELGSLRLQMDLKGEALALRIDTSTHVAHRLLSADVDRLRHGLEASGIQLERIEVRPPTQGPEVSEQGGAEQGETQGEAEEGSGETDAEHPQEHGRDSHPARSPERATGGTDPEPATESLVNLVA